MALAKRKSLRPLMEPSYRMEDVPRCAKDLSSSVILRPSREQWQASMGEIVLLCNEAVARATVRRAAAAAPSSGHNDSGAAGGQDLYAGDGHADGSGAQGAIRYPAKPLSIEFIADRLDIDDPLNGMMVRDAAQGRLQGFVSWTTFTNWQRHFRWDSLHPAAAMEEDHVDEFPALPRANDDGSLAKRLAAQVYDGDVMGAGVVSPRIAEIALLGALGCGKFLMQTVIAELELPSSPYDFVVLQATEGSIPFYESLGFVRVGAVCRYLADDAEGPSNAAGEAESGSGTEAGQPGTVGYDHEKSYCTSKYYYYTDTRDNDTPRQIASRLKVDLDDMMFINQVLWGPDGITSGSKLRRGTPLRVPCSDDGSSGVTAPSPQSPVRKWHVCRENDTPKTLAKKLGVPVAALVKMNAPQYKGLTQTSMFRAGSKLLVPTEDYTPEDVDPDLTEWVT